MPYDYFYGAAGASQYAFFRIPKLLVRGEQFHDISTDAKLLYGLMLDRLQLSIKNRWFDEDDRVYIVYTIEDIMEDLNCGNQKAVKTLGELEKKAGLIIKKRRGVSGSRRAEKSSLRHFQMSSFFMIAEQLRIRV